MTVRPSDLQGDPGSRALRCGECLIDYPAVRELYEWMFEGDVIVCVGCGAELMLWDQVPEEVMVES